MSSSGHANYADNLLPDGWVESTIGAEMEIITGSTPSTKNALFYGGNIPFVKPGDLDAPPPLLSTSEYVTTEGAASGNLLQPGSVLVSCIGTLGKTAILGVPAISNQQINAVIPSNKIEPLYLYYYIQSLKPWIEKNASATTVSIIRKSLFANAPLILPPLEEQRRIAKVLSDSNAAIFNTKKLIEKLKLVQLGLLIDLLTFGIDEDDTIRSRSTHDFVDSPNGLIPESWSTFQLQEIASIQRGKFSHRPRNDPNYYGGDYPFVQTGDVSKVSGHRLSEYTQTLNERGMGVSREFPAGTLVVTIAANIADTAILDSPMYFPDSIVGIIPNEGYLAEYIQMYIEQLKRKISHEAGDSTQKNINLETLKPLIISVPPIEEQVRIVEIYASIQQRIIEEREKELKYSRIKSGLMSDLLTGQIRVPEASPADVEVAV